MKGIEDMKLFATFFLAVLLCGCSEPKHVSPVEFANHVSPVEFTKQYRWVGQPQTMHDVAYLGQRGNKAFIRVRSMSMVSQKWSDHIIYVELTELEASFRDALPKTQFNK